eukprot:gene13790-13911_t
MMRERSDVKTISSDAIFLVAQAAEMFVQQLAERSLTEMVKDDTRRKHDIIEYKDIAAVVHGWDTLDFLRGPVPRKVLASTALDMQQGQLEQQ